VTQSRAVIAESQRRINGARAHIERTLVVIAQTRERMSAIRVNLPHAGTSPVAPTSQWMEEGRRCSIAGSLI
jgi:hypothetical protein